MRRPRIRSLAGGAAGIAAGVIGGIALTAASAAGPPSGSPAPAFVDAAHVPPVLTVRGEPVSLRYAIVCPPRDDGRPCDGSGTVYLRAGGTGAFRPFALARGADSVNGRYFIDVPADVAGSPGGFSYYAVLRDERTGASITVPAGGADAPQVSRPLQAATLVQLGRHVFGNVRAPDAPVAAAGWGASLREVGLAGTRELGFAGPSSFDVEDDGTVDILDSVNGRVLRWARGRPPEAVSLGDPAELADFAVAADGSFDVLEPHGRLKHYLGDGTAAWEQQLADRTWAKLAHGRSGPVVLQQPSEQWMPAAVGAAPLTPKQQGQAAHTAKHLANGGDVLVDRVGESELRVAELHGGKERRSWRIMSATPLGEVQLAESHGNHIVVVTRAYTENRDEFEVLLLDRGGLAGHFAAESNSWTETAPLARFRLTRDGLYRLRTTPSGTFVDRFDLEVPQ